jgi:hypothetical protein
MHAWFGIYIFALSGLSFINGLLMLKYRDVLLANYLTRLADSKLQVLSSCLETLTKPGS